VPHHLLLGQRPVEGVAPLDIGDGVFEAAVSEARMPILSSLRLTVNPGVGRSTKNMEMPW
jgi:hypothetical protein